MVWGKLEGILAAEGATTHRMQRVAKAFQIELPLRGREREFEQERARLADVGHGLTPASQILLFRFF